MSLSEKINDLSVLKEKLLSLELVESKFQDLGIGYDVPLEAAVVIEQSDWINNKLQDAFLGYDAFSEQNLSSDFAQFYELFNQSDNLQDSDDLSVVFDSEFHPCLELDAEEKSIKRFLPLYSFQGNYIVIDLLSEKGELYLLEGFLALFLAPSLEQHISDLINGLSEGIYHLDENLDIVFPSLWLQREGVKSGRMKMDKYGEVSNNPFSRVVKLFNKK